jgi:hypothetical protein
MPFRAVQSALLVEVPAAELLVGPWRERFDPVATRGVPAHVTTLFPFRDPIIDDEALAAIGALCRSTRAWEFELSGIDEFPDALWLRPEPAEPFQILTGALWRAFPDRPPYGGRFLDRPEPEGSPATIPHLTVAQTTSGCDLATVRRGFERAALTELPLSTRAVALSLFVCDGEGSWERAERFDFAAS